MKKIYLFVVISLLFNACNFGPIPNKSISEDLTEAEIESASDYDPKFQNAVFSCMGLLWNAASNEKELEELRKKYKHITYKDCYEVYKFENDEEFWDAKQEKWSEEWEHKFGTVLSKVDETMLQWDEFVEKNSLNDYTMIYFSDLKVKYYRWKEVESAEVHFCVAPNNCDYFENLEFMFVYTDKETGEKKTNIWKSEGPFTDLTTIVCPIDYYSRRDFEYVTTKNINDIYDLDIIVLGLKLNGKEELFLTKLGLPEDVLNLWVSDTRENRENVAKLIEPKFVNKKEYMQNKEDKEMKKFNKKYYKFVKDLSKK